MVQIEKAFAFGGIFCKRDGSRLSAEYNCLVPAAAQFDLLLGKLSGNRQIMLVYYAVLQPDDRLKIRKMFH